MYFLLIDNTDPETDGFTALSDDWISWTIGSNSLELTGEDEWTFAGWNWEQDCYCEGVGAVIGFAEIAGRPDVPELSDEPA